MREMSTYLPHEARVLDVVALSRDSVLLTLSFTDTKKAKAFKFNPGQFIELSIAGYGEIPVGIASPPSSYDIQVSVRNVGNVSAAVHRLEKGDLVGVRGPFGNGFEKKKIKGKDILIISGGCGIPPIRSLLLDIIEDRKNYGDVTLLYGSKTQKDLLFKEEYKKWGKTINVLLSVDKEDDPDPEVDACGVGQVTTLIDKVKTGKNTLAVMCGPPIMYKYAIQKLLGKGVKPERILVSLERRMKCGIGKCQHCTRGGKYVCTDGPVFTYKEITEDFGGL